MVVARSISYDLINNWPLATGPGSSGLLAGRNDTLKL